jgi:hypothetical protein
MNPFQSPPINDCERPVCAFDHWVGIGFLSLSIAGIFAFGILLGVAIGNWTR